MVLVDRPIGTAPATTRHCHGEWTHRKRGCLVGSGKDSEAPAASTRLHVVKPSACELPVREV
ncbi:hypothetical protein H310_08533 [Aphanomyces invadans]|uniref:Uncharacterized protein n=1 Tax=Aphanomyces invadans TaxID=157072 RepID=A0A024TYQ1_9STRA|nr:hypothetical protein H310_08533 [Aphanomyces invadans]ETV99124.1 hypothetical protein H310_08533 [Aphanomyces invadans]|eukprot:XP_008872552.1 hypothetical protein H310_08533 [Aphanomyces invadans]